ncbi:hypothetical protein BB561_002073 [Smittium simulii]|uniref:Uncharacterized protein n=1 Tax=Smittium simulii TaxID=133385 RepID=A0A2T9YRW8_9FUNG|nr:hypothetical protein BB561_002073 [Smittium simulii]
MFKLFAFFIILQSLFVAIFSQNATNPYGVQFKYSHSKVLDTNQKIVVKIDRTDDGSRDKNPSWSYLFTYNSALTIEAVSINWSYAEYSNLTLAFVPPKDAPLSSLEFTVRNISALNTGISPENMAIPIQLFIVNSRNLSGELLGYNLSDKSDYTITQGQDINSSVNKTLSDSNAPENQSDNNNTKSNSTDLNSVEKALELYARNLYKPGDPNYDSSINPIGTQLVGPLYSLWIFTAISVIGIAAYIYGTLVRLSYRKQYYSSVNYT